LERLSTTVTSWPCSSSSRTVCEPMYPAPPVTKIRFDSTITIVKHRMRQIAVRTLVPIRAPNAGT
jgi:hypothetical protein